MLPMKPQGLERWLVQNIVQYANQLPKNKGGEVDLLIFTAQMAKYFDINSPYIIQLMYENNRRKMKSKAMTVEDYAKCVCMFLSDSMDLKVEHVFRVYDFNGDGVLDLADMNNLLKPCILKTEYGDDSEIEESLRELVEICTKVIEQDSNKGNLDVHMFRKLVKQDSLYLELLGRCLPSEKNAEIFKAKLTGKTPYQISLMFADERATSLSENVQVTEVKSPLYPIPLDMP
ncbi:EF-hand calcium-binding domain-containing protein 1 [Bulinus truncatus]|nr:EF-hand calcium-binding domain-containing protein 1 [Bulinus truncatus]